MPRDGCKECSRRRIKCDKGTPECAKCVKKGIQCTGIGRQIRFVEGTISKGKRKGHTFSNVPEFATRLSQHLETTPVSMPPLETQTETSEQNAIVGASIETVRSLEDDDTDADVEEVELVPRQGRAYSPTHNLLDDSTTITFHVDPGADLKLELLKPGIQMLFNHFSQSIASIMVIFDTGFNGYRNFLLPMAYQDDLVQRAVSVVAAFHLSTKRPDLIPLAETGLAEIIKRLRADAFAKDSNGVFSTSTWATIILLLVGETVTGSRDFVHLYPMLTNLLSHNMLLETEMSAKRGFLLQQSRMFQLFTPPLLDLSQGCKTFEKDLDFYLDFIFSQHYPDDPRVLENTVIFREAIKQAKNIYMRQALDDYQQGQLYTDIEQLRRLVLPIHADSPCMHTLPWVYFIAAASSKDTDHRNFFAGRLAQVYEKTRMNSIIVALERLGQIWLLQPNGEWARNPSLVEPVLII
ncbi:uncharacterized protein M437DRAFT_56663 [Aureobasidium melanogenum CBS 110374]|uniref:Zn(2)-C6 fungal-type domain-containing protein n=1 Tax=Aureobasidium melanogenum (strain CBS 110374) TaxID=1043003 RepID=A0A074VP92_AURM1|nr:uncharacterized protein M437DRAFT_56663 [Aureobasidium melanogenum CBS 110374]KEQ59512.1 hypothetical protein M437DRAFT_56663 [Aureobasidium melanogenum CBS 110374]